MENLLQSQLVDVEDSVLLIIDVQSIFVEKLTADKQIELVERIGWLAEVAIALKVPLLVTAEDVDNCGGVVPELAKRLPQETAVYNKLVFGLADQPDILGAVHATGRGTAVLVGLETDVCVAQSAIGLRQAGFKTAVVIDAVGSPGLGQEVGLARMQQAGTVLLSTKSLYYEWVRTVARDAHVKQTALATVQFPNGLIL